ncbi:MAG: hypothetical protein AAGA77_13790 [Bacteroidota bacterium]
MKKIILALLVLGIGGASVGYYMYTKPVDKMNTMSVDETVSAEQIFTAFEEDEMKANEKYLDKVVVIKGTVTKTSKDAEKATIFLDTGDMLANIMCQMEDTQAVLPAEGETISVKGLCTGYLTDVVLIKGIIH